MKKDPNTPKSISRKELADALNISADTATKFLRSMGITNRKLDSAELRLIKRRIHPLFFKMTREVLAKIYQRHPETFANTLLEIGINHQKKLSYEDLQNIYWKLRPPAWIVSLGIDNEYLEKKNVENFYQRLGIKMTDKWYNLYFQILHFENEERLGYFDPESLQYLPNFPR